MDQEFNENSVDSVLSRLETKMDILIEEVKKDRKDIESLKQFKYWLMGAAALIPFVGDALVEWLRK
jgi:hypothetical protein